MTEKQKEYVFAVGEEIKQHPEGKKMKVYASETIVRIQDTKNNANYRMVAICKNDTEELIRAKMMNLFRVMIKEKTK